MAEVKAENLWGYVGRDGEIVVKPAFRTTDEFAEGLAGVEKYDKPDLNYGFIDREGRYAIPPKYESVSKFTNGLCFAELADEIAYIDHSGELIWTGPYVDVGRISQL